MFSVPGAPALSQFRLDQLLRALRILSPQITTLSARWMHFIDVQQSLSEAESQRLAQLLRDGTREVSPSEVARREAPTGEIPTGELSPTAPTGSSQQVLVTPRLGTVSPWSSKATDIARVCGLQAIRRIERGTLYGVGAATPLSANHLSAVAAHLHDPMTESIWLDTVEPQALFHHGTPRPLRVVDLSADAAAALAQANREWGLALSHEEIVYLVQAFRSLGRDPTDVELMMFAQANSEHCRHKIFNARFIIDDAPMPTSLFAMIRATHAHSPDGVLSAYRDNASVIAGPDSMRFFPDPHTLRYGGRREPIDILMKVETHNHPTAISPFPGAATGAGGEIRDEGATGIGAHPKAGLTGYSVSNLKIPGMLQPWEEDFGKPPHIASALQIMLVAPLGAAAFNNEFGRPNTCGYFRVFEQREQRTQGARVRGYHKPIMLAGGLGNIRRGDVEKKEVVVGAPLVVLGGPSMLIGLGGGAASSLGSGQSSAALDFASVQRANAEMQRRAQEVIDRCWQLGEDNPILLIHDVGAGGLSNALPEAIAHSQRGGRIDLRKIPSAESELSPMEIWCNEAQERYVLALVPGAVERFALLCERERCPFAVVGEISADGWLRVTDRSCAEASAPAQMLAQAEAVASADTPPPKPQMPVDMPLEVLLGKTPQMTRIAATAVKHAVPLSTAGTTLAESLDRLLCLPTIADKSFLITIGDRNVGGLISRDQMVGPWQVPVADVAVSLSSYEGYTGEAMAIGERAPAALLDAPASGRLAVAEALTNILAADIEKLGDIRLSANWMAACGEPGEDADLYATVRAVSELCIALGIAIPVGKDSLSMRTTWRDEGAVGADADGSAAVRAVVAPISLVVSAFAPVVDARRTLTPQLDLSQPTRLLHIDLGAGRARLGGSCWAQVHGRQGGTPADLDHPQRLIALFQALREMKDAGQLLAYHDVSDGGVLIAALEMAFASQCALQIDLGDAKDPIAACFAEEPGVIVQVPAANAEAVGALLARHGLGDLTRDIGEALPGDQIEVRRAGRELYRATRTALRRRWSEVSFRLQELRDNPQCAREEYARLTDAQDPGLHATLTFDPNEDVCAPYIGAARPAVAVLREQGVNSQTEMAAVFTRAGFDAYDVHMTDILSGRVRLGRFHGMVMCGGFSYGDVLGAGEGWAKSILFNTRAREEFAAFFDRGSTFTLGVCNGCQMLAALKELVPGAHRWPRFVRNLSEQYEARVALVRVPESQSVLLTGMQGSILPIVVAHGEGRAQFSGSESTDALLRDRLVSLQFVDTRDQPTERYPYNPNGSAGGLAGLCSEDGRVTCFMPHPERVYRTVQNSWAPPGWGEDGGWMRLFRNARVFVD